MSLKSHIEVSLLAGNQERSTASLQNAMSDAELELVSGAGHPVIGNPDMTDPQVALRPQQLSQGLRTAGGGAGFIKSMVDASDALIQKI